MMVQKKVHNGSLDGSLKGGCSSKLTGVEKEVLALLTEEYLTPKKVAIRRKCSRSMVYRIMRSLKKKGALTQFNTGSLKVHKSQSTCERSGMIRLHGQEFNIKILFKDERYRELFGRCNVLYVDGNTVRLYRDSIEVYSGHSFMGEDPQKATARSFEYWNRFFVRLENDLKVILVKPRHQNIRLVNSHYAEVDNELAEDCEVKDEKIRIFARDDGKLWFLIDNSFNLHEAETVHPVTAKRDMERFKSFANDFRENPEVPNLSDLMKVIADILKANEESARVNKETAAGLNAIVNIFKSQMPDTAQRVGLEGKKSGLERSYFG